MTPERWRQIKEVFNSALKYEPAERSLFLSRACYNDTALQKEVESLLSAHERDGSFIDSPAYKRAAEWMLDEPPAELKPGEVLGSYEITSFIGRGGMGDVYLAQDKRLRRKVALKFLSSSLTKDVSRMQRFEQEARAASALNHPNIIPIYEICEVNSSLMMAAEFVEGVTLRQRLTSGPFNLNEVLTISIQIADALSSAHKIIFAGQRDGVWNIYTISIKTRVQKQLTNYSKLNAFVRYPAWSPERIVYEYAETTGNIWMLELK